MTSTLDRYIDEQVTRDIKDKTEAVEAIFDTEDLATLFNYNTQLNKVERLETYRDSLMEKWGITDVEMHKGEYANAY